MQPMPLPRPEALNQRLRVRLQDGFGDEADEVLVATSFQEEIYWALPYEEDAHMRDPRWAQDPATLTEDELCALGWYEVLPPAEGQPEQDLERQVHTVVLYPPWAPPGLSLQIEPDPEAP